MTDTTSHHNSRRSTATGRGNTRRNPAQRIAALIELDGADYPSRISRAELAALTLDSRTAQSWH